MAQIFAQNLQQVFDEGSAGSRGEGEAQQQQPHKLAQNLQMPQKKKEEETKSGKKTRCQRQQRRDGDVDVGVGGSPCLTQLCTKFMIFYLSVGEGEQPGKVGGRGTGRERIAPAFSINSSP